MPCCWAGDLENVGGEKGQAEESLQGPGKETTADTGNTTEVNAYVRTTSQLSGLQARVF